MNVAHYEAPIFGRMLPAMVTPFDDALELDIEAVQTLADSLIVQGADGLVIGATTGESPTLTEREKLALFAAVVEVSAGRVPVVANIGSYNTAASVDLAQKAAALDVDGIMAVIPYYNKPPQEGLYQHFKAIAQSVELPMVLYNIPGRCSVNMTAETTLRLANDVPNIAAVKEASGNFEQIKAIIDGAPEGFTVYSGDDAATFQLMKLGGHGVISTSGNIAVKQMKAITDACAAGDFEAGEAAHNAILPVMDGLFRTTNPILVKAALNLLGYNVGSVRLPLVPATDEQIAVLEGDMRAAGLLA